jgi:tetratricopeptide (TPR) repeat protein
MPVFSQDTYYANLLQEYNKGKREHSFLYELALAAQQIKDDSNAISISNNYITQIHEPYTAHDIHLLELFAKSPSDNSFQFIIQHSDKFGVETIRIVQEIIHAAIRPLIFNKELKTDLNALEQETVSSYGKIGELAIWQDLAVYYSTDNVYEFVNIKRKIHQKYPDAISIFDLNNDAWSLFENTNDKNLLQIAIEWSKVVIEREPTGNYYDTYANLLYKSGKRDAAIKIQEQGLQLPVGNGTQSSLLINLEKMKQGKPTWE